MSPDLNRTKTCNIASALIDQAERQGDNTAIHYPLGKRGNHVSYDSASYSELNELSDDYARGLIEYGIGRGIRTALMLTPGLDFFAMFFALFKAGAVPVLIDPGIGIKPLKTCLAEARPEAFIGVTKAQVARKLLGWAPKVKLVTAGPRSQSALFSMSTLTASRSPPLVCRATGLLASPNPHSTTATAEAPVPQARVSSSTPRS